MLLACAPGELHLITLVGNFALASAFLFVADPFLGADTPIETLARAAETTRPALVVVSSFDPALLEAGGRRPPPAGPEGAARARRPGRNGRADPTASAAAVLTAISSRY